MTPTRRFLRRMKAVVGLCLWYFLGLAACGPMQTGPFSPTNPRSCAYDGDCAPGQYCGFLSVDTHPVCREGQAYGTW